MSVATQVGIHATICTLSGFTLLLKPSLLLRSPLDPIISRFTGLPPTPIVPAALAPAAIAILAIGLMHWNSVWSGDDKLARASGELLVGVFVNCQFSVA